VSIPPRLLLRDLLDQHRDPPIYIVEKLLAISGMSLLVAHPKAGKSTFVRSLMTSISRGQEFLGRKTQPVPILYYILEEPIDHVAEEFRQIGIQNEVIFARVGRIEKQLIARTVAQDIKETEAKLVVIDPLFDALAIDDANGYGIVNNAMKELLYIARGNNCHILTVHHTNKRDIHGGLAILGSQALRGATDCNMMLLRRNDGTRLIESEQRLGDPFDLTSISFDEKTRMLNLGRPIREDRLEKLEQLLLDYLGDKKLSTTQWRDGVKGRSGEKTLIIQQLEEKGIVKSIEEGRYTMWIKLDNSADQGDVSW